MNDFRHSRTNNFMQKEEFNRSDAVIGIGGGAVTDLAGFIASSYMRGITYIQIPTSLLAQVDASIGGVFALIEETKSFVPGLSRADSITMNPQKLLGITKTSSLLLVANTAHLSSCFSIGFPYLEPSWGSTVNGGEIGIQGTRPAEILFKVEKFILFMVRLFT